MCKRKAWTKCKEIIKESTEETIGLQKRGHEIEYNKKRLGQNRGEEAIKTNSTHTQRPYRKSEYRNEI